MAGVCLTTLALALGCHDSFKIESPIAPRLDGFGDIRVTTTSSGARIDRDGYQLHIRGDGVDNQRGIGINDTLTVARLPIGDYDLELSDLDGSCRVVEGPRSVYVDSRSVAWAPFGVECD